MHILLITPGFPKDENDSTCLPMIQEFLTGFQKIYPDVMFTIVSLEYPYRETSYIWNGLNVIPLGGSSLKGFGKLMLWRKAIKKIHEINFDQKFDVVHAFWLGEAALIANRAVKKFSIPAIATLMGQDALPENSYLPFISFERLKLIALSEFQAETLWKTAGRKVDRIIPWGISKQDFDPAKKRDIDILGVGSLIPLKNYKLFVNILDEVRIDFPDIKAEIIGDGIERNSLKGLINKLNLEKNIKLTGELPHNEIMEKMKTSKILLHTANYEGFGYVFAEALANGMYLVSKKTGAANESWKWLVAKNDEKFVLSIENLLNSEMNFKSHNLFLINNTVELYFEMYNEIIT